MLAAPDHHTNNEADFQDSYTNLIIGAHTNHHINHSPPVKYYNPKHTNQLYVVSSYTMVTISRIGPTLALNDEHQRRILRWIAQI